VQFVSSKVVLSGKQFFFNQLTELTLEEGAKVRYSQVPADDLDEAWVFDAVRTHLKKNSSFDAVHVTRGSALAAHDYRIVLREENAETTLKGICMLSGKRESHNHVVIDHQAPHCRSTQLFKGVLDDTGRSSFEGKILVKQQALKTDALQQNHNLLLSDQAHVDSKPNLEILADDVKVSHGATVGKVNMDQLFFLKTRGFSETQARNLLVQGFCQEVIDQIPLSSIRENCKFTSQ